MVELAEIQAAYYMVAATGVLVAAIYYVYNMRAAERNKKIQLARATKICYPLCRKRVTPQARTSATGIKSAVNKVASCSAMTSKTILAISVM